jgi:hypothetical protein
MRNSSKLVLLGITTLAVTAVSATSALAGVAPLPGGDYERDNWKKVLVLKSVPPGNPIACSQLTAGPPVGGGCTVDSGSNASWYWKGINWGTFTCPGGGLKTRIASGGKTFTYDMSWQSDGVWNSWCNLREPDTYVTDPTTAPLWYGSVCRHVPSGKYWDRQQIVAKDRLTVNTNNYTGTTFGELLGTAETGGGILTTTLRFQSTASPWYTPSGFVNGYGDVTHRVDFPFPNMILRTAAVNPQPCDWGELT